MEKRIVIRLYDHAGPDEVSDLLAALACLGLSIEPVYQERAGETWVEPDEARLDRYARGRPGPIASRRAPDLGAPGSIDRTAVEGLDS